MKKSIFVLCAVLTTFSLTAFGYFSWNHTGAKGEKTAIRHKAMFDYDWISIFNKPPALDLLYKVDHRFRNTVTKENLNKAQSILDILPGKATESIVSYSKVKVTVFHDNDKISEPGDNGRFTPAQLQLLQSTNYTTPILISAVYQRRNATSGELENSYLTHYMTIVPEKEAVYTGGYDALIHYLKENSRYFSLIVKKEQLQPGKVSFTVTRAGNIADVFLISTSGYPAIDGALVELVRTMPGSWDPATGPKGEKIDQQLVFFFGPEGC